MKHDWSHAVRDLTCQHKAAKEAASELWSQLQEAAIAELPVAVGDKVEVGSYGVTKVGRVTRVRVDIESYTGALEYRFSAYPFKKDGTVSPSRGDQLLLQRQVHSSREGG
jgi:hypothetical protein